MKDKNGKELKIGDVVSFCNIIIGKVTEVKYDAYRANWENGEDTNRWFFVEENIEIKSAEQETFTEEDEELLQKLINKKSQALKAKMAAEEAFDDLRTELYKCTRYVNQKDYLTENIDKICDTLQNYKEHCVK